MMGDSLSSIKIKTDILELLIGNIKGNPHKNIQQLHIGRHCQHKIEQQMYTSNNHLKQRNESLHFSANR